MTGGQRPFFRIEKQQNENVCKRAVTFELWVMESAQQFETGGVNQGHTQHWWSAVQGRPEGFTEDDCNNAKPSITKAKA